MQDNSSDDPVARCPGPCDAVIPIVYPNQPITIPYSAIRGEMSLIERAAIDEVRSVRETFTQPNSVPPLSISSSNDSQVRVLGLGHAGVAFYSGTTGEVAYYEYGRYTGNFGHVRQVPAVARITMTFDEQGNPEASAWSSLLRSLTTTNGGPYAFNAVYVKVPNGSFDTMKAFAEQRKRDVAARTAAAYDVSGNHCFTFTLEVASQAGVNANVSTAPDLELILRTIIGGRQDAPADTAIEVPARQILVLQSRYRALDVSSTGSANANFEFPAGLYAR